MKDITFSSNFGRFAYSITCEIGDEVNASTEKLCMDGLANIGFRAVASDAEKALVKAGLSTKDAKRGDVAYSAEAKAVIEKAAQEKLDKLTKDSGLPEMQFEITGEHVFGETEVSRKLATALWEKIKSMDAAQAMGMRLTLGIADDASEATAVEACHKFLAGLKAPAKVKDVAKMAEVVEEVAKEEGEDESAE